jgi:hypothetical protein
LRKGSSRSDYWVRISDDKSTRPVKLL